MIFRAQTIRLNQPIAAVRVIDPAQLRRNDGGSQPPVEAAGRHPQSQDVIEKLEQQKDELARLLETVNNLAAGLHNLRQEMLVRNRPEIARLAVEIARRVLVWRVERGDYQIEAVVEEALKRAPTRQQTVIRLNPEDLPRCQQLQQENPESPFAGLELRADGSIGRGECLVDTPKGMVKSFIEEHLERIREALQKVE